MDEHPRIAFRTDAFQIIAKTWRHRLHCGLDRAPAMTGHFARPHQALRKDIDRIAASKHSQLVREAWQTKFCLDLSGFLTIGRRYKQIPARLLEARRNSDAARQPRAGFR